MADTANHIFLPWVQSGGAAAIPDSATERLADDQPAAVSLKVRLEVNTSSVEKDARLFGPGSIIGLDPQQVVRVEPKPYTSDFEPNYFPAIEFDRPDLPWLFTPAKANTEGQLRPWMCLVVVRIQDGVELLPPVNQPLAVLHIKSPAKPGAELPDLAESHLWAHAQIVGSAKSEILSTLKSKPAQTVSRLICPRRLAPSTNYVACVVPAFDVGVKAGLGESLTTDTLKPAWLTGDKAPEEIRLPVYFVWHFHTSEGGDFEELVRRLKPREMPAEAGKRPMNIGAPGFALDPPTPDASAVVLGLEGALQPVDAQPEKWPEDVRLPFQRALAKILNTPWDLATTEVANPDPIFGPPVYGCWHAAAHRVGVEKATSPAWLNELNLDPRNRVIAAMGTQVIQQQQEQLMASAWEQLGDIDKINQRLRQAQLSRAVNKKYYSRTFSQMPEESFLKLIAPARSLVTLNEEAPNQPGVRKLLSQKLSQSRLPPTAVSATARKLMRPGSAMNKELSNAGAQGVFALFQVFGTIAPFNLQSTNRGSVTVDQVTHELPSLLNPQGLLFNPDPPAHFERPRAAEWPAMLSTFVFSSLWSSTLNSRTPSNQTPPGFFDAAKAHHAHLTKIFPQLIFFAPQLPIPIPTMEIKASVMATMNPERTVSQATMAALSLDRPALRTEDELEPIMDAPAFPQPMYEALRDLSQDYLFPGLEHVPANSAQLLKTNGQFIESFMVGLNAEMGRELLWRNYPTDQRGTYFRQFWDTAVAGPSAQIDIKPIHEWGPSTLGANSIGNTDKLVLLIRGEVVRRYPGVIIYAVKAVVHKGKRVLATDHPELRIAPPIEAYPVFRGTLEPDVVFVGFDLKRNQIAEGDGWFFVLQQQPTEPRFGLDDDPFGAGDTGEVPLLKTWNDLNWAHVGNADELSSRIFPSKRRAQNQASR
jgi:hypothetical protein